MRVQATTPSGLAVDPDSAELERVLTGCVERAAELTREGRGHYHTRTPYHCPDTDPAARDCLGMHPAIQLARTCRRTERQARKLLTHAHIWAPYESGSRCTECGQVSYERRCK